MRNRLWRCIYGAKLHGPDISGPKSNPLVDDPRRIGHTRRLGWPVRSARREPRGNESRRLGGVQGHVAVGVAVPLVAGAGVADRVDGVAQVDRLGPEQLALGG